MKNTFTRLLCATALTLAVSHSFAADSEPSKAPAAGPLAAARAQIADKKWAPAIEELT